MRCLHAGGGARRVDMATGSEQSSVLLGTLTVLTVVSGMVDAVSYLGLGHVFTANMTGNVVLLGFAAAGAPGSRSRPAWLRSVRSSSARRAPGASPATSPHDGGGSGGHGDRGRLRRRRRRRGRNCQWGHRIGLGSLYGDRLARLRHGRAELHHSPPGRTRTDHDRAHHDADRVGRRLLVGRREQSRGWPGGRPPSPPC